MTGRPGPSPLDDEPERADRPGGRRRLRGDSPGGRAGRRRRPGPSPDPDGPAAHPGPDGPDAVPGDPADEAGDPESVARAVCLRALTGAPKTRQQLADLLERRGVPEEAATAVLDRFGEVGLVDDAAFARAWVSSRQAGRGLARRALKAELRAKGVDGEDAEQALALVDDEDERAAARRLVERRLSGLRRVDRVTATRRLVGMLARKGYGGGLAAGVVRDVLDETGFGTDPGPGGPDGPGWEDDLP
ncbi:regulatory protein [Geodermatophilus dictyosporus]|uniref:Regulatory protein RecX n=1 Tax=Geodermatophilus dictyosporus TaxID=1523247 RepID=A0A1I5UA34_9ACTN|nr:regulatory protein RecX [Geodermatophilus dictyosporus]SFP92078.1 regulatory protein [Geodermatophilus dictyosporus]